MSRSVSLQQAILALVHYLSERIQRANDTLSEPSSNNIDGCNDQIDSLTEIQQLIETSITKIEQKDADWQNLMNDLDEDGIKMEHQIYEQDATAETNGYFSSINQAQLILGRISTRLRMLNRILVALDNFSVGGGTDSAMRQPSRVKTPKIVLPIFEGDILRWKEFWSIFSCTIHDRDDLSRVEKFSYLVPHLKGRAKRAIEGLLVTEDNYEAAIDMLKKRFDRGNDRIVSMLYSELKQLSRYGTRCHEMRSTFDTCERIFRQLVLCGEDIDSSRAMTIDLLSKFPAEMVRDLYRHYKVSGYSKLSEVRSSIEKSISELEATSGLLDDLDAVSGLKSNTKQLRSNSTGAKHTDNASSGPAASGKSSNLEIARETNITCSTMATSLEACQHDRVGRSMPQQPFPASNCYFCGKFHYNSDCAKYTSARQREYRLFELRRCIRCSRTHNSGGNPNQCHNYVKCFHCKTQNDYCSALCSIRYPN